MFTGILPDNWQDYTGEPEIYPDLYIDREHEDFLYKLTLAPNGKITRIQQASAKLRNVFVKALLWC